MGRRRRGEHRHVYVTVPTRDGKKVAVRSATIAERLFGMQETIQAQSRTIERLKADVRDRQELLEHIAGQRLVKLLVWLRLVSIVKWAKPAAAPTPAPEPGVATS